MHKATPLAATAVVVLALTLTGCGNDDEKGSGPSGTSDKAAATPSSPSASASATRGPSATPSRTDKTEKRPRTDSARPDGPASTRPATTPAAPRTSTAPPSPTRPAAASSVQGTWYYGAQGQNGMAVLTVSGTSWTLSYNGSSCPGTITADLAITSTCQGESASGRAVVSNNGQNLAFNWNTGTPDHFVRTKPTG
ncbi:hypothetical protein ACH4TX_06335 [Streptomyces sp. NPDC021098]|uniref:hypothetical protein n=1 Tax=unclassified Streptomyces TaxID=2593676 RepID=UPI00378E739D